LLYPGPFTMLKVHLAEGESIKAEAGAMIAMSPSIEIEGKMEGGFLKSLSRMLAGESFFFQTLAARRGPGESMLAHGLPGGSFPLQLDGLTNYLLHNDAFFPASP